MASKNEDGFLLALETLKPYLPDIVISGGWVPFVYHRYLETARPEQPPLGTKDIDITVPPDLSSGTRPSLGKILGGAAQSRGATPPDRPGAKALSETIYELEKDGVEIELTFMTPRAGRDERPAAAIPAGVVATLLRYVDVLLASSMKIRIKDLTSGGQRIDVEATFPTPEAYCFQKGLSFVERADPGKKGKDLYYIFDLLSNYPELRTRCESGIPKLKAGFPPKWYARFLADLDRYF
ncbi:MAG TPA: GSU2403 family nucleotidyltransferase fold protein, partial [Elusimicrobiales bacterium]|nr:GSU2403 family nucleotidyltransferase fold protein [Elusimicrobiales bacterium]